LLLVWLLFRFISDAATITTTTTSTTEAEAKAEDTSIGNRSYKIIIQTVLKNTGAAPVHTAQRKAAA